MEYKHHGEQESVTFQVLRESTGKHFLIEKFHTDGGSELLEIDIERKNDKTHVTFEGKTYREFDESGNVYAHLLSQYEDVKRYTDIDVEKGVMSEQEQLVLEIGNLFHDIPEIGALEKVNNNTEQLGKTSEESAGEMSKGKHIIADEKTLTDREKELLNEMYDFVEDKKTVFKYFEHLRYAFKDNKAVLENKKYMNNHQKLFAEISTSYIERLFHDYRLPSGKIVRWIDLPSTQQLIRENYQWVDEAMSISSQKEYFERMHPEKQAAFEKNVRLWEEAKRIALQGQ